jgi:hypothetical protein
MFHKEFQHFTVESKNHSKKLLPFHLQLKNLYLDQH